MWQVEVRQQIASVGRECASTWRARSEEAQAGAPSARSLFCRTLPLRYTKRPHCGARAPRRPRGDILAAEPFIKERSSDEGWHRCICVKLATKRRLSTAAAVLVSKREELHRGPQNAFQRL